MICTTFYNCLCVCVVRTKNKTFYLTPIFCFLLMGKFICRIRQQKNKKKIMILLQGHLLSGGNVFFCIAINNKWLKWLKIGIVNFSDLNFIVKNSFSYWRFFLFGFHTFHLFFAVCNPISFGQSSLNDTWNWLCKASHIVFLLIETSVPYLSSVA